MDKEDKKQKNLKEAYDNIVDIVEVKKKSNVFTLFLMASIYKDRTMRYKDLKKVLKDIEEEKSLVGVLKKKSNHRYDKAKEIMKKLDKVHGVGCRVASAFLHFYTNGELPIFDKNSWRSLMRGKHSDFTPEGYIKFLREYEKRFDKETVEKNMSPRILHRELNFELYMEGKIEHQKART